MGRVQRPPVCRWAILRQCRAARTQGREVDGQTKVPRVREVAVRPVLPAVRLTRAGAPAGTSLLPWRRAVCRLPSRGVLRHFPPLCVLPVVLVVGVYMVGDYGLAHDQRTQYRIGHYTVDYVLGERKNLLRNDFRYYGAAFELLLQTGERILGLTDEHHVYLSRYVLSHCFFLGGAFACYLLGYRLFRSRLLATFAMLLFLFHPRLYGHSFYNSKDGAFLSMFMIALVLLHGALRSGRVRAYAGLGLWVGLIASVRPLAFLLVMLVPLVWCVDFVRGSPRQRKQLLLAAMVLFSTTVAACVAALPYLWGDPVARFAEWFAKMSDHPHVVGSLFLGDLIVSHDRPWSYVPVWFAVTTPPMVTALAVLGVFAVGWRVLRDPAGALSARRGFETVLVASVLVPMVVVTLWVGNLYNGWRQLHFVYGPVCLLACAGLAWLGQCEGRRFRTLAATVAAFGLAPMVAWIAILHPHQNVYFSFLVDRKTPERLRTRFDMDYWAVSQKEAIEALLDLHPQGTVPIAGVMQESIRVLSAQQRSRIVRSQDFSAYFSSDYRYWWGQGETEGPIYVRPAFVKKVYSNTLYAILRLQVDGFEGSRYQVDYHDALANPPVWGGGGFRVYWDGETVTYVGEGCTPGDVEPALYKIDDTRHLGRFFLHVIGDAPKDAASAGRYFHNEDFQFRHRGIVFNEGGRRICMARVALGGYAADAIRTGQLDIDGAPAWSVQVLAADPVALGQALRRVAGLKPTARGGYDVHVEDGALVYVKTPCAEEDMTPAFFLHLVPFNRRELAREEAKRGFANRDFTFATHGAVVGDACVLRARLPSFRAREVRTGQYTDVRGEIWRVELALARGDA